MTGRDVPSERRGAPKRPEASGLAPTGRALLAELLPAPVVVVEAFADIADARLFPAEEAAMSRAVDRRRREYATARACAHQALTGLGVPAVPILVGERGAPQWPPGIAGSITHCAGYRAAAAARTADLASLGLDAEPDAPLPGGVLDAISLPGERAGLAALGLVSGETGPGGGGERGPSWDRLLFSAKESVYKAWFPLTGRWLGFADAEVTISPDGSFRARLLVPGPELDGRCLTGFTGRWLARDGLVVTAIAVPPDVPA
jgi:4'-phosphopantetheinyl transferase EntD